MQSTASHHDEHHGVGHVVPTKILYANCIALLVLTVITVLVARIDFAAYNIYEMNIIVALAVAFLKAVLVCLFFMHLYWDRPFNSFVLVGSLAFVVLFMAFAMIDVSEYRNQLHPGDAPKVDERLGAADTGAPRAPATGTGIGDGGS